MAGKISLMQLLKVTVSLVVLLLIAIPAFSQIKKGQKLFEKGRYSEAIKPLRKSFSNENSFEAGILLAKSYYKIQEYQEAYDVISVIGEENLRTADNRRFYADVLIANDDFSGAYVSLVELISENQADEKSFLWLDKVSDLLAWDTLTTKSTVQTVQGINSFYNEYAPYFDASGDLWFVSDLTTVQTVFPNSYNNQSLHLYYRTKLQKGDGSQVRKPSWAMEKRDYYYHDGPITKWPAEDSYVLTLRDIDAPVDGLIGLYFSKLTGTEEDIVPFKYNEKYNTGHATFMNDGTRMIFASDRPGGFGQMDLWYSDWKDGTWSPPVNMGPNINTPFNELFPTFNDTRLYFSSDRRDKGYGGLDIYFSSNLFGFKEIENLRAPINGPYDDFSLTFINSENGYFTSNRKNGEGGDDIYLFSHKPEQKNVEKTTLKILNASLPPNTAIEIYDSYGDLVQSTAINRDGEIIAENLKSREIYTLKVPDVKLPESALLGIMTRNGQVYSKFNQSATSEFKFELLPTEEFILEKQENEDDSQLQYVIDGKVVADDAVDLEGIPVSLISAGGVVLSTAKTEKNGKFTLTGAQMDEEYTISTKGIPDYHEIDVYGKSGAVSQSIKPIGENKFAYTRSAPAALWMTTSSVKVPQVFAIVLNNEPVAGEDVILLDGEDNELKRPIIDEDGFMDMGSLIGGNAYRLHLPNRELDFDDRLVILDGQGDTSQTVRPFDANNYFFEYLLYRDYGSDLEPEPVAEEDLKPAIPNEIFKIRITEYGKPERSAFLLKDLDAKTADTLYANSKGIIIVRDVNIQHSFQLHSLNSELAQSSSIQVFNQNNSLIYQSDVIDNRYFNVVFLQSEDFGLAKESNADESGLELAFQCNFTSDNSANTKVELRDSSGALINSVEVNSTNVFVLDGLNPDSEYYIHTPDDQDFGSLTLLNNKSNATLELDSDMEGVYSLPKASSIFVINIASEETFSRDFVLTNKQTGKKDTIQLDQNGEFTLQPSDLKDKYDLSILAGTLPSNSKVQVFEYQNNLVYEAYSEDDISFILEFLEQDEYDLAKEDNNDSSVLNFGIEGRFITSKATKSKVELFNMGEEKLAETYTNSDMLFELEKIPSDRKFIIRADFDDKDARVEVENSHKEKQHVFPREKNGDFLIDFEDGSEQLTLKEGDKEVKVSDGAKFNLSEVYYDFNSYRLKSESKEYLNKLVSLLDDNPGVKVQIQSHTDSRGPSNYNKLLSQKRADAVIHYLQSKGIDTERLESVGFGETELTNKCADGVPCTNAEHAKNRRTEFVLLRNDS